MMVRMSFSIGVEDFGAKGAAGVTSLSGRTNFADSIEDEWVIVYLLRELTTKHKDIWVKVVDSDGQFLLVEAAGALPAWLEPDIADNRVCSADDVSFMSRF